MLENGIFIPQSNFIPLYNSMNGYDDRENQPPQKQRRVHKGWIYERTFDSKEDADKFLKDDNFSYYYENKSSKGIRITYRCSLAKFRGDQCEARAYILIDSSSTKVQLFRADSEHTHQNHPNAIDIIPVEVQEVIQMLFENNVTTLKQMELNLAKKGFDVPEKAKLKTVLKKLSDSKTSKEKLNCGSLEKWLEENTAVPDSDTKAFVMNYEMNYENEENIDFRFVVSSKQLLSNAIKANKVHADATYKLIWQGFPVLVVGFTDMHRKFILYVLQFVHLSKKRILISYLPQCDKRLEIFSTSILTQSILSRMQHYKYKMRQSKFLDPTLKL